jgi:hypothetical protein
MIHERSHRIEVFDENGEPHSEPRWHKRGEGKLCETCDEGEALTLTDRGMLLDHLERLQMEHPEAKLGVRETITNIYHWPPLVTEGYEPSPNDQRQLDLDTARSG